MAFGIKRKETRFARTLRREDEDFDEEDELEEDEVETVDRDRKRKERKGFAKKLKDLNSEDRKARKEPVKPWGAKERLLVLIIILATAGISGFLALSARGWKLPQIKTPSFSINNIFKEEVIMIEGEKSK